MKVINVPSRDEVTREVRQLCDQIQKRLGNLPNLHATIGHAGVALKAFLQFEDILNEGVFKAKEREGIASAVSQVNGCNFCLAAHSIAALRRGFSNKETLLLRKGEAGNDRLNAVVGLAISIAENRGHATDEALETFFAVVYDEAALMELIGLVTARVFTNYVYAVTNIPVDFPLADVLN